MRQDKITVTVNLTYWLDNDGHTAGVFFYEDGLYNGIGHYLLIKGNSISEAAKGINYIVTGSLMENNRTGYDGIQCEHILEAVTAEPILDTEASVVSYLSSLKGIGDKKARAIVDAYGVDVIDKIKADYNILTSIKGISGKIALSINQQIKDYNRYREFRLFLASYGMSDSFISATYAERRKNNPEGDHIGYYKKYPYDLLSIQGAKFDPIDKMALSLGYSKDSTERIYRASYEVFKRSNAKGHTALPIQDFCDYVKYLIGVDVTYNMIEGVCKCKIISLKGQVFDYIRPGVVRSRDEITNYVMTNPQYRYHIKTIDKLAQLAKGFTKIPVTLDAITDRHPTLDDRQIKAVYDSTQSFVTCITGGPGTGKTTVIKAIINEYKLAGLDDIMLLAPTGKAARRMEESTGYRAMTIHRGMHFRPDDDEVSMDADIEKDLIIIDEMSMVDFQNFSKLLTKTKRARFVFVGDADQLSSVGPGRIFKDLLDYAYNSGTHKVTYDILKTNHRQGAGSTIAYNARLINKSDASIKADDTFTYEWIADNNEIAKAVVDSYTKAVDKYGVENVIVLTPTKKTAAGVINLNKILQDKVNPYREDIPQIIHHGETFRLGDIVMQTVNAEDVVNGDVGKIVDIEKDDMTVEYPDNRVIKYARADIAQLTLAYALTIHKSQGSEYKCVIYCMPADLTDLMCVRNLPYTAITRAKERVKYIGTWDMLYKSITTENSNKRISLWANMAVGRASWI